MIMDNGKRLLSRIVSLCDETEYYAKTVYTGRKESAEAEEIHGFELVDDFTPSKLQSSTPSSQP